MKLLEGLLTRRSVRVYDPNQKVDSQTLGQILNAAMHAPSAMNKQPWHFVVVDKPAILQQMMDSHPYASFLKEAGTAIVLCADLTVTVVSCLLTQIIPETFGALFTDEMMLIKLVKEVMPVYFGGIWIFGVQMACQSAFMGMGQAKISLFLALLRKVLLLIPLALILPNFYDVQGIYYAEPVADILAAVTTGTVFILFFKKLLKNQHAD